MWKKYNPNPIGKNVGDCAVRAICKAFEIDWVSAYCSLCAVACELCDLPSANAVWGLYLKRRGFKKRTISEDCGDCYNLCDFCKDHSFGVFVVALSGHVATVVDGDYFDTWDSGAEIPIYYFAKE